MCLLLSVAGSERGRRRGGMAGGGGGRERGNLITDAAPTRVATYSHTGEDGMTPATA